MTIQTIISKIKQYHTIIIHRHVRPDPDAIGSQAGLKEMIMASFPEKNVWLAGDEEPSLSFLAEMDDIPEEAYHGALVIVCDTANQERISDERYNKGAELIKIDHHPEVDTYGDYMWIDTKSSSTSEMIYELFLAGKDEGLIFNANAARLIFGGIVGDTGRFLFPSASPKTFSYAADLVAYDFDRPALYDGIYNTEINVARLKGYILQHFQLSENGMCNVKISKAILEEFGLTPSETSQLTGMLGEIKGIKAWIFFIEEEELIRVRLRSKGPVINQIAAKYNGGGHPLASGAYVHSWEEAEAVIADVDQVCNEYESI